MTFSLLRGKTSKFQQLADLPEQYCSKPIITDDDRIIIPTDKEFIFEYIPNNNKWTQFSRYPDKLLLSGHSMCINTITKQLIIYDGKGNLIKMDSNNPNNSETLSIDIITMDHSLCFLSNNNTTLNIIGGFNNNHHYISQNDGYSFIQITTFDSIKHGIIGHCIINITKQNKLLMCGGWDYYDSNNHKKGILFDKIWQYDGDKNTWRVLDNISMPHKMCGFGYILSADERFLVIFGGQKQNKQYLDRIYYMDLCNMEWIKSSIKCPKKSGFHAIMTKNGTVHLFERVPNWKYGHYTINIKDIIPQNICVNDDMKCTDDNKDILQIQMLMVQNDQLQVINDEQKTEMDTLNERIQLVEESNDVLCAEIERKTEMYEQNEIKLERVIQSLRRKNDLLYKENTQFEKRCKELEQECLRLNTENYRNWDCDDVLYWIINLENKRFVKYEGKLGMSLAKENINGTCLDDLDKGDLHRLGIDDFKDKKRLLKHIASLNKRPIYNNNDDGDDSDEELQIEGPGNATPFI